MPESKSTDVNWQLWCRLCAKDDPTSNVNIVFKDEEEDRRRESLSQYLFKYFEVQMDEALPKMLCTECFSFVTSLVNFAERVEKVQQMFQVLMSECDTKNFDYQALRLQFGILENDREHIFIPQTSLLEVHYFDSKPKIDNFEEKIFEDDANPLEQHILKCELQKCTKSVTTPTKRKILHNASSKGNSDENEDHELFSNGSSIISSEISDVDENFLPLSDNQKFLKGSAGNTTRRLRSFNDGVACKREGKNSKEKNGKISSKKRFKQRDSEYTCTECSQVFKRVQHFRQHMKRTHSVTQPFSNIKCTYCPDRLFSTQHQLDKHLKVHLPPELKRIVPCPYCDKKFSSNSIVQTHIKYIHNNDRSFICEECGVTMRTNAALKAHMLTHTDFAPFECLVCKKGFKNQIRLKNHMETHDPHKHICAECGLQLNSRATLNRHLLVHSDVMLHKCDYCGRAFKRAKALKNHLILHTGLKPYSCDFCDRTFANGSNCRSHKKKAHPEELAALEASGGKQYTRNIPKLEALKAVTKAADNLAPVVSKHSGRFAFGKKQKNSVNDLDSTSSTTKPQNSFTMLNPETLKSSAENSKSRSIIGNRKNSNESVPMIDTIYSHILKQAHDLKKQPNTLTSELNSVTLPDGALEIYRQQLITQSEQTQTPASDTNVGMICPCTNNTLSPSLIKLQDLSSSAIETHLRQPNQQNPTSSSTFLCQNDVELQRHQQLLISVRSPESQTSHISDDHSHSPPVSIYPQTRRDLSQGAFL